MAEPKIIRKKLADYIQNPRNPVKHSPRNLGVVIKSINSVGAFRSGAASKGKILAGNLTWEAMAEAGIEDVIEVTTNGKSWVIVNREDLTPEQEKLAAVADQRGAELADWDAEVLAELKGEDFDFSGLFAGDELAEILKGIGEPPEDPGAQIDKAEALREKWGVQTGQLWQCGEHKVICGDCTDRAVVNAVAFGELIDLYLTDPPYGVSYADKNEYLNAVAKGNSIQTPIINDHLTVEEAAELWHRAFGIAYEIAKPGCVYYVHAPQGGDLMMMMMSLKESGWLLKPQIIWVKNNHVLGRSDYQLKHEPILYGWKDGGHYWGGGRSEMSVWEIGKPMNSDLHPTTKPVELAEKAIGNSSRQGEFVFDGFLGSGTTLIACERLGRKCRGIEISPAYVAVTLQRWADMTGQEPQLVKGD